MAMSPTELADALTKTGFLKPAMPVDEALREYQKFHQLPQSATPDVITERSLNLERFCGLPDKMELGATMPRWNKRHLRWKLTGVLAAISMDVFADAYREAFDYWSKVCGITHEQADQDDISVATGHIDGPFGTLAWSELASGDSHKQQKYDSSEKWVVSNNPPQGRISLVTVACHEIGHVLGLPHTGVPHQLMNPTYNPLIGKPQANWDVVEVVQRYGKPTVTPPPPPPPGGSTELITIGSRKGRVTWDA